MNGQPRMNTPPLQPELDYLTDEAILLHAINEKLGILVDSLSAKPDYVTDKTRSTSKKQRYAYTPIEVFGSNAKMHIKDSYYREVKGGFGALCGEKNSKPSHHTEDYMLSNMCSNCLRILLFELGVLKRDCLH